MIVPMIFLSATWTLLSTVQLVRSISEVRVDSSPSARAFLYGDFVMVGAWSALFAYSLAEYLTSFPR